MVAALLLSSCSNTVMSVNKHHEWEYMLPNEDYIVNATGYAPIDAQHGPDKTQKMIKAIKASKLDAYREITEKIYGHQISSKVKVSDLILGDESLKASVNGVVKGARIIKTYQLDGIYITELELNLRDIYRISAFTNGQAKIKKARFL